MKGTIVFNGNIRSETDFIGQFRDYILSSNHENPVVHQSRKVLLITAAWQKREFHENHVKKALYEIGLQPRMAGGFDQNIQNLAIYHDFNHFRATVPDLHAIYHSKQKVIQQVKKYYREKNSGLIAILQKQLLRLKKVFRNMTLHKALSYDRTTPHQKLNHWELLYHYACQDIQETLQMIRDNDARMLQVCHEIDAHFFVTSRVADNEVYCSIKTNLEERIRSANSIFIFGGHLAVLYNRLNFFKLRDVFAEALESGTNFYTVSAGSMCLCDYIVSFDEDSMEWSGSPTMSDFELFDTGFGLVQKIQMFPHCKDYIHMHDPDTVTYLAQRFKDKICLGLDQGSFLQMETYRENGAEYERFTSIGKQEGLYIFEPQGHVRVTQYGEELALPGTKRGQCD